METQDQKATKILEVDVVPVLRRIEENTRTRAYRRRMQAREETAQKEAVQGVADTAQAVAKEAGRALSAASKRAAKATEKQISTALEDAISEPLKQATANAKRQVRANVQQKGEAQSTQAKGSQTGKVATAAGAAAKPSVKNGSLSAKIDTPTLATEQKQAKPTEEKAQAQKPKSAEAIEARRQKDEAKAERKGLQDAIKNVFGKWNGDLLGNADKEGDLTDAAGTAVGGIDYAAFKELSGALSGIGEDEDSLAGILKKKLEDKTGITAVKQKAEDAKAWAVKKVTGREMERSQAKPKAQDGRRDKFDIPGQGRKQPPVAASATAMRAQETEEAAERQEEKLQEVVDAIRESDKNADKRNRALQQSVGGSGGGIISDIIGEAAGDLIGDKLSKGKGKGKKGLFSRAKDTVKGTVKDGAKGLFGKTGGVLKKGAGVVKDVASKGLGFLGKATAPVTGAIGKTLAPVTGLLRGGGKLLSKSLGPIAALALGVPSIVDAAQTGDKKQMGGAVGSVAGSMGGAAAGAALGTMILPGVGTLIGGILGSFAGDFMGEELGERIGEAMSPLEKELKDNTEALEDLDDPKDITKTAAGGVNYGESETKDAPAPGIVDKAKDVATDVKRETKRAITGEKVNPIEASEGLGSLSAKYESGKRGSDAVGFDSTGGTSYGKYQIATRTGTMDAYMNYIKDKQPEAYERLKAAGPADSGKNGKFAQEWKKLSAEGKLGTSEHDFIKATHFDPAFNGIENKELRDKISGSKAMQDVLWSTSVQHGGKGASKIMNKVYKEGMTEEELISAVYKERGTKFGSSTPEVQASVHARFAQEEAQAKAMFAEEKRLKGDTAVATADPAKAEQQQPTNNQPSPSQQAQAEQSGAPATLANANMQKPEPAKPISMREEMAKMDKAANQPLVDTSGLEKRLDQLVALSQEKSGKEKDKQQQDTQNNPNIPTEFDDTTLVLMAHDRV